MRKIFAVLAIVLLGGLLGGSVRADTFELANGETLTGDLVLPASSDGVSIHLWSGKYQKVAWIDFSQKALQEFAKNPKLESFVNPMIERPDSDSAGQAPIVIKPVDRLIRPEKQPIIVALVHTPVGLAALLLIYAVGLYGAYEISLARSYPPALVCGVSAVAPVIGQVLFLALPTRLELPEDHAHETAPEPAHAEASWAPPKEDEPEKPSAAPKREAESRPAATAIPETQSFKKGQFMFNRRFFETKFPGFTTLVRRDADKHMVLVIKSVRGEYEARRISKMTANDIQFDVRTGGAQQDVVVPYIEIQEVTLKHEDA